MARKKVDTSKILTVRERMAIKRRNPNNPDVEALLAEGDALRKLLARGSRANKVMAELLSEAEAEIESLVK